MILTGDLVGKYKSVVVVDHKLVEPEMAKRLDGSQYETGRFLPDQLVLRCTHCQTEFKLVKATVRVREVKCPNPVCPGVEQHRLIAEAEDIDRKARMERRLRRARKVLGMDQPTAPSELTVSAPASNGGVLEEVAAPVLPPPVRRTRPMDQRMVSCIVHLPIDMLLWVEARAPRGMSRSQAMRMVVEGELELDRSQGVPEADPKVPVHFTVTVEQMRRLREVADRLDLGRRRDERGGVSRLVRDIIRGKAKLVQKEKGKEAGEV